MVKRFKILLVDDEPDIIEFLGYNLRKDGYLVETAGTGKEALSKAVVFLPDLVILDIMMPDMDGIELCEHFREVPKLMDLLIVFLTARNEDYSIIAGYDAGADDYITKPVKPKVLTAKIKALMRRSNKKKAGHGKRVISSDIVIDRERFIVLKGKKEIILPKKQFELLEMLSKKPGKVFSREEIFNEIWGGDTFVGDRTIDVHIRKIRMSLGDDIIKTVKGVGYKYSE